MIEDNEESRELQNTIHDVLRAHEHTTDEFVQFVGDFFTSGPVPHALYGAKEILLTELEEWLEARGVSS